MKIAVFTDAFAPQVNGVVTHLKQSIDRLSQKHSFVVFAPNLKDPSQKKFFGKGKVKVQLLKSLPFPVYEKINITSPADVSVYKTLKEFKPDIYHFHTPFAVGMNGILGAQFFKKPLIGSFHTYIMEPEYLRIVGLEKVRMDKNETLQNLLWRYTNLFYNRADLVITPSKKTKQDLIDHKVTKPIEVVSNGVDIKAFSRPHVSKNALKIRFGLKNPYLIYLGRVSKEKSLENLIEAYAKSKVYASLKPIDLVIVGDGPHKEALQKLTHELGVSNHVIFTGNIPQNEIQKSGILKQALCFVTASTSETQGITFLEAMASGLPIIGARAKAAPELIHKNGVLCEPHNVNDFAKAIRTISLDKEKRKEYTKYSLLDIHEHDIAKTVEKLEEIYERFV